MSLYTGRGDQGETDLMGGPRVRKDHYRIEAIGAVDELNSALGLAISFLPSGEASEFLVEIQNDLFTIGAELSLSEEDRPVKAFTPLAAERVGRLEKTIGGIEEDVGPQKAFVLPGGSQQAAFLHFARAVARRTERRVVALGSRSHVNPQILRYLNRLSSLLHAMALKANRDAGVEERNPTYA
ncbi:MAG: cob(I)yrinic acid a,c-diamide adenosyltransferase [Thermoplasmata archaeon]